VPPRTNRKQGRKQGWWLLSPLTLFLLALLGFPLLADLIYSVSQVDFTTLRQPRLMGLDNYAKAIDDAEFWAAAWFSLRFGVLAALIQLSAGLGLALFLAPLFNARPWLMAIMLLPMMVAPALVGLMYRLILHEFVGPVPYYLLEWWGDFPAFLSHGNAFWTLLTIECLQWTPFALLILYSAYSTIADEIHEAAALDGADGLRRLLNVDLPLLLPTIGVVFFIRFIDSFRVFDNIYTLVGAGAGGSTTSMSIYIYQAFFKTGDIGLAVAASLLLLLMSFIVLWSVTTLTGRLGSQSR
jgi:multiple sugar transport system permease protein